MNQWQSYATTSLEAKYDIKTVGTLNLCNRFLKNGGDKHGNL